MSSEIGHSLEEQLKRAKEQALHEKQRADGLELELKHAKEQYVAIQTQLEQEEEAITNKLIKRLDLLKKEKADMEAEEELLTTTLEKRLAQASREQEVVVGRLQKQLEQLKSEKSKLHSEKIALENHLEAEQEFIMNKLQKQVDGVRDEKRKMAEEKAELAKQVAELATTMERLKLEKVKLEQEMEVEEENITNRLQRQVDCLLLSLNQVETRLQARGSSLAELGVTPPAIDIPGAGAAMRAARASSAASSLSRGSSNAAAAVLGCSPGKPLAAIVVPGAQPKAHCSSPPAMAAGAPHGSHVHSISSGAVGASHGLMAGSNPNLAVSRATSKSAHAVLNGAGTQKPSGVTKS